MGWMLAALLAPALYSAVNFIDKYILEGTELDYWSLLVFTSVVSLGFALFMWGKAGMPVLPGTVSLFFCLSGALSVWGSVLYFKAISRTSASTIIVLLQLTPVMVLVISYFFLHEELSLIQFAGFFIIIASAVGLIGAIRDKAESSLSYNAVLLIFCADVMWAVSSVLFKIASPSGSVAGAIAYQNLGFALGGIVFLVLPQLGERVFRLCRSTRMLSLILLFLDTGLFLVGKVCSAYAISRGPVSLVSAVGSTQAIFAILFGWIFGTVAPAIFKENIARRRLLLELIMASAMVLGLWLIA
ncbi:MAG: DMT family transporter [Candidatus Saccharibacteria bacterium]